MRHKRRLSGRETNDCRRYHKHGERYREEDRAYKIVGNSEDSEACRCRPVPFKASEKADQSVSGTNGESTASLLAEGGFIAEVLSSNGHPVHCEGRYHHQV